MTTPAAPEARTVNPHKYDPPADPKAKEAWDKLIEIGAPVLGYELEWGGHFAISGECNYDETHGEEMWAGYWEGMYVHPEIIKILNEYGLYVEWANAGVLSVYDA
jgi:hypothetical protein